MADVIRMLRQEHANINRLLAVLDRQVAIFESGSRPDYDIVQGVLDYFMSYPDLYHHPKEDLVLAKLRQRDPAAAEALGNLDEEHRELADLTRQFAFGVHSVLTEAQVPRESFRRWAHDFIDFQRRHLHREETKFLPAAKAALTADDWADVEAQMTQRPDPLFGDEVGERYEALREDILRWEAETSSPDAAGSLR